jgi:hypothetical protein
MGEASYGDKPTQQLPKRPRILTRLVVEMYEKCRVALPRLTFQRLLHCTVPAVEGHDYAIVAKSPAQRPQVKLGSMMGPRRLVCHLLWIPKSNPLFPQHVTKEKHLHQKLARFAT